MMINRTIFGKTVILFSLLLIISPLWSVSAFAYPIPWYAQEATVLDLSALRAEPAASGDSIIRYLEVGETVVIVQRVGFNWLKVKDSKGHTGYITANSMTAHHVQFIDPAAAPEALDVLRLGKTYLGTPYEYGSNRNDTSTFDCSDFIRHIFLQGIGISLPSSSKKQAEYARKHGLVKNHVRQLQAGDVVFFMDHLGSKAAAYTETDKSKARVSHVGIVTGQVGSDLYIMHATKTSKGFSGVKYSKLTGTPLEYRLLFGADLIGA